MKNLLELFKPTPALKDAPEFEQAVKELHKEMAFIKKRLTTANYLFVKDLMEFAFIYGNSGSLDQARLFLRSQLK